MAEYFKKKFHNPIAYDEFLDTLRSYDSKVFNEDNIGTIKELLQRLYYNRDFLADHMNSILKDIEKYGDNYYSFQVFVLSNEDNFTIRAPIWMPPLGKEVDNVFAYGDAHDHNFNLMTLGYYGPGYTTSIWEYDVKKIDGNKGESVELGKLKKIQLEPGSVLYMRANTDIHVQHEPEDFSITLNIMKPSIIATRQYLFDIKTNRVVKSILEDIPKHLFHLASIVGNDNTIDIIDSLSKKTNRDYENEINNCTTKIYQRLKRTEYNRHNMPDS